jgi:hypothetical protein
MASNDYPKTVTIHGSGGDAEYCAVTGEAVTDPYTNEEFILAKIDLREYLEYWNLLDPDGISLEIDVCDIGGWNGLGAYVGPEFAFRAEALLNRMELFETRDPKRHFFDLTLATVGGRHEIKARRNIADMAPIFDGEAVVGRWNRIDHACETIRALCGILGCSSFTVQV